MKKFYRNPFIQSGMLPADVVFHPSWWHKNAGIVFDEDFFYHPLKRIEVERKMEQELYQRFGKYGPGNNAGKDLPVIGAVHIAAGYILSEMLGCKVIYSENSSPQVVSAEMEELKPDAGKAFKSSVFKRFLNLQEKLKARFNYIVGDINWGGVLNTALDLAGEKVLTDFYTKQEETQRQLFEIAAITEKFVAGIMKETGSSSISVNRTVGQIKKPVFLHSECSHTMISTELYEEFLLPVDMEWSKKYRPFGIHYCGKDPHRYAETFAKIENLDFLDVGWGGDVEKLRKHLPHTFLNIRLDPVALNSYTNDELKATIIKLVNCSGNPYLTGVCCINMDDGVDDSKVLTIFETVETLKIEYSKEVKL